MDSPLAFFNVLIKKNSDRLGFLLKKLYSIHEGSNKKFGANLYFILFQDIPSKLFPSWSADFINVFVILISENVSMHFLK